MKKVAAAIRMLATSLFQEYTSRKREKGQRTYNHQAFGVDELDEYAEELNWELEDPMEEDLETLAVEDDDASMVLQFENFATFYASYQDARKRLLQNHDLEGSGRHGTSRVARKEKEKE